MVRSSKGLAEVTQRAKAQYGAFGSSAEFERYVERFTRFMQSPVYNPTCDVVAAKSVLEEYGWSDFSVNAALDEYLGKMKDSENKDSSVDSLLFATSFAAALQQAQDDYEEVHIEQERLQSLVEILQQSLSTIERVIAKREEHADKQQQALVSANETIAKLKAEIGEIRRQQLQRGQHFKDASPVRPVRSCIDRASPLRDIISPPTRANASPMRDLVSPSRVGVDVYINKQRSRDELRTRSEMRSRSILSSLSAQDNY